MNFNQKVWKLCSRVPRGKITTYKLIAGKLGTRGYRAVGTALSKNPYAPKVPCHRVINSSGFIGGFKGKTKGKAIIQKKELLGKEGIKIENNKIQGFETLLYRF